MRRNFTPITINRKSRSFSVTSIVCAIKKFTFHVSFIFIFLTKYFVYCRYVFASNVLSQVVLRLDTILTFTVITTTKLGHVFSPSQILSILGEMTKKS